MKRCEHGPQGETEEFPAALMITRLQDATKSLRSCIQVALRTMKSPIAPGVRASNTRKEGGGFDPSAQRIDDAR